MSKKFLKGLDLGNTSIIGAILDGLNNTISNINYSSLTGTVPTWNQNTTGNAATATDLSVTKMNGGGASDRLTPI